MAGEGYSEVQLLGQNVNSYRDPSPTAWDFAKLLDETGKIEGLRRVRFTTSHPRDFGKRIVDAIEENEALCNHVHLPVQSGSDAVLDRMRRLYRRSDYMQRVAWMKNARRDIAITSDIIVGFPGESEADFNETLRLIDEVEYDAIFIFKYSKRPNTPALAYEDHIPKKKKRGASLCSRNTSALFKCAAMRATWENANRCWWKATTRPPTNGLGVPASTKL